MVRAEQSVLRWGVLGTGWISTNFVKDLLVSRDDVPVHHVVRAIGTSTQTKGQDFVDKCFENANPHHVPPQIYTDYAHVYADTEVDIVYIGTPHALHKEACLAAIEAGKHVLCEKPITINARDAKEVVALARAKGVFLMEAVWTRFLPIVRDLQRMVHREKIIGNVHRMFCDFGLSMDLDSLPSDSRLKNPALGAGALLDIGIYPLTFSNLILDGKVGAQAYNPDTSVTMTIVDGVDRADVVVLRYPQSVGILTGTTQYKTARTFCRIEGSEGSIEISGLAASIPSQLKIIRGGKEEVSEYNHAGLGFHFEADAVALDIAAGRLESSIMPPAESIRMMEQMDSIRKLGGLVYPQDK